MTLGFLVVLVVLGCNTFALAFCADGDCRALLAAWAGEHGLTVLRCRGWGLDLRSAGDPRKRFLYRVTAVDAAGRLRTGWAVVAGRFWKAEFNATGVEVRWVRVRTIPRPASPSALNDRGPLWDDWVDGGPGGRPTGTPAQ